jgi:hypothetical protein
VREYAFAVGVIGDWRRSVLGASGVALLLPLGLALGVAVTTAFGGAGTLRALGQVFAGPSAPTAAGAPGLESARGVPTIPRSSRAGASAPSGGSSATPSPGAETTGAGSGSGGGATGGGGTNSGDDGGAGGGPPSGGGSGGGPSDGGGSGGGPSGGGGTNGGGTNGGNGGGSGSGPSGTPVHQAGQQAADAVRGISGPAGDAVQTVVDLLP